jgi:hypothetical protein
LHKIGANWPIKSQASHFQPQFGAKQPDHAEYVNADGANGLEIFTNAVRSSLTHTQCLPLSTFPDRTSGIAMWILWRVMCEKRS